jgi:hypothetical protein
MKKTLIFTVGLLIMMSILVNCAAATPVKNPENGHWYEVVGSSITWEDAKTAAQALSYSGMSGHLATITSEKENNFVSSLGSVDGCWLGGFQSAGSSEPNGGWQWVTGESWSYTNWNSGEPNDMGNENALQFWNSNVWNDKNGNNMYGYIVEYEPTTTSVPEFPSIVLPVAAVLGILVISGRRKI